MLRDSARTVTRGAGAFVLTIGVVGCGGDDTTRLDDETAKDAAGVVTETYLSDLTWSSATNGWGPVEKDKSNGGKSAGDGKTITLNGATYAKGLGVHASSDVRYGLAGKCSYFRADVGVDDEVGTKGSLVFRVWGDGVKLYDSGVVYGSSATKAIDVNVTGRSELRLVVSAGGNGNASDHADWAKARVGCTVAASTDTKPPTVPQNQKIANVTQTSATMSWSAASDDVGVTGYAIWLDGKEVSTTTQLSHAYAGLTCGKTYVVGLQAYDAAGNRSNRAEAEGPVTTAACGPNPPPAVGNTVEFSGTVTSAAFNAAVSGAPAGALTVRPAAGQSSFTVSGNVGINRPNVTVQHGIFRGFDFDGNSAGGTLEDSKALQVNINGADDVTLQRNLFDGECTIGQNFLMPEPEGNGVKNFRILDNTFKNYHVCADESVHSEALYIGALSEGRIEGNEFTDNGTTGHIFFTWWGGEPGIDHPRNICVTGNHFVRSLNGYYHTQGRAEIPPSANINVDPNTNTLGESIPGFDTALSMSEFIGTCQ